MSGTEARVHVGDGLSQMLGFSEEVREQSSLCPQQGVFLQNLAK